MTTSLSDLLQSARIVHGDFALLDICANGGFQLTNTRTMQLHLMLSGEAHCHFPNTDQAVTLKEGNYLFAPTGTAHSITATAGLATPPLFVFDHQHSGDGPPLLTFGDGPAISRILSCAIESDRTRHEALVRLLPEIRAYRQRRGPTLFSATPLLSMDALSQSASGAGASAFLLMLAELLLVHAMRDSLIRGASPASGIGTPDSPQIAMALRLIHEHPERNWSVGGLAREVGMSRSVFATSFESRLDETPIRYVRNVRMMRAETLLRDGGRSLAEIAHLTGYKSEAAFARAFKREFARTPGLYRRKGQPGVTSA